MSAKKAAKPLATGATGTPAVDAFVAKLKHPRAAEIDGLRETIRGAAKDVTELVKWNGPSFRRNDDFATIHWRDKKWLGVILHRGAKSKDGATKVAIDDPRGLLEWLATDRAIVKFYDAQELADKRAAFAAVVKQWVKGM